MPNIYFTIKLPLKRERRGIDKISPTIYPTFSTTVQQEKENKEPEKKSHFQDHTVAVAVAFAVSFSLYLFIHCHCIKEKEREKEKRAQFNRLSSSAEQLYNIFVVEAKTESTKALFFLSFLIISSALQARR